MTSARSELAAPPARLPAGPAPPRGLVRAARPPALLLRPGFARGQLVLGMLGVGLPLSYAALVLSGLSLLLTGAWGGDRPLATWAGWVLSSVALFGLMAGALVQAPVLAPALGVAAVLLPLALLRRAVRRGVGLKGGRRRARVAALEGVLVAALGAAAVSALGVPALAAVVLALAACLPVAAQSALQLLGEGEQRLEAAGRAGTWLEQLEDGAAEVADAPWGLLARLTFDGLPVTIELVDVASPAWVRVSVPVPGLDPQVVIRGRRPGDPPLRTADPVLARFVTVLGGPAALVEGLHDALLPVVQGEAGAEGSEVSGGAVRLVRTLPSPPRALAARPVLEAAAALARALSRSSAPPGR